MSKKKKEIIFIINPISGKGKKRRIKSLIPKYLEEDYFKYEIIHTEYAGHATEISQQAVKQGKDAVIAVGGDGTVQEVGKSLIGSDTALGILPTGSGNGLARHLGIPMRYKNGLTVINRFGNRLIDTATLNGHSFLGIAGVGFDAHVGGKFAHYGKRGFMNYVRITTNEFFKYLPKHYKIIMDGKELETDAFIVAVSNSSQYGNNAYIAPGAALDDGLLEVSIIKKMPLAAVPGFTFQLFNRRLKKSQYLSSFQAKNIRIVQPDLHAHLDGEPLKVGKELNISVIPHSLKVIC